MIPHEVPDRRVLHDVEEDGVKGTDLIVGVGAAHTDLNWPTPKKADLDAFDRELRDREARRIPCGFRAATC